MNLTRKTRWGNRTQFNVNVMANMIHFSKGYKHFQGKVAMDIDLTTKILTITKTIDSPNTPQMLWYNNYGRINFSGIGNMIPIGNYVGSIIEDKIIIDFNTSLPLKHA